jgi:hypothetical protein
VPGKPRNKRPRKLTSILTRVLDFVRSGEYRDYGEYMVFGTPGELSDEVTREIDKASKALRLYVSRVRINRRTALNDDPDLEGHLRRADLADIGRQYVEMVLGGRAPKEVKLPKGGREDPATIGDIEKHFADELVKKLPKLVERAASLDEIGDQEIERGLVPDRVKRYWQEAHRCYLYGFPIACAVLCRSILESALVELIDPDRRIHQMLAEGARKFSRPKESYIGRLVEEATKRNILTDDRPKCAIEVRDAGNDAIHKYGEFEKRLNDPLRGIAYIVDSTRKILIDLYSGGST